MGHQQMGQQPMTMSGMGNASLFPETDLKVYARILWHWAWLITLGVLVAAIVAFIVSNQMTPIYRATTALMIQEASRPDSVNADPWVNERFIRTYAELMTQPVTMDKVAERLQLSSQVLNSGITNLNVTQVRNTQLLQLNVEGTSPQLIKAVADTLPQVFIDEVNRGQTQRFAESKSSLQEQLSTLETQISSAQIELDNISDSGTLESELELNRLRNTLSQYQTSYANLFQSFETVRLAEIQSADTIMVTQSATTPRTAIRPRPLYNTLQGAFLGALLALGIIFLIEYLDDRIRSPDELTNQFGVAALGTIGQIGEPVTDKKEGLWNRKNRKAELARPEALVTIHEPRNPVAEAYRNLRTNLRFANVDADVQTLLVTSTTPGEGKTVTTANLAIVMAQSGLKVLLVDADLRKPKVHQTFGQPQSPGLTDLLVQSEPQPKRIARIANNAPNLSVISSGKLPPNPAELLGSKSMAGLIRQMEDEYDVVLFDTPPILSVADPRILAKEVSGVVLVANATKTQRGAMGQALEALYQVQANVLGVVLNQVSRAGQGYRYYYYQYDHAYYYETDSESEQMKEAIPLELEGKPVAGD